MRFVILWLALLSLAAPAAAQTSAERERLDWTVQRGQLLFALDRAAWVGTDDMLARMGDPARSGVRGYLVDREGTDHFVIFYALEGDRPVVAYRGRIGPRGIADREVFPAGSRPALTPRQLRLVRTLDVVRSRSHRNCGAGNLNVALVPPATDDGPIDAYVMTAQTSTETLPVGGHARLTIDAAGRVTDERAFTNACLNIPVPPPGPQRPVALMVTHLLDPIPTEIHVFTALAAGLPLMVATSDRRLWQVTGDDIQLAEDTPGRP